MKCADSSLYTISVSKALMSHCASKSDRYFHEKSSLANNNNNIDIN